MLYSDSMLDLETLGTGPNSVITQIGIAAFNRDGTGDIAMAMYNLDPQAQIDAGLVVDWSTIGWWLGQSEQARNFMASDEGRFLPSAGLGLLDAFLEIHVAPNALHWANSPSFDHTLIRNLYRKARRPCPFSYQKEADVRTLKYLAPDVRKVQPEVAHHAAHDAKAQAIYVQHVFKALRK